MRESRSGGYGPALRDIMLGLLVFHLVAPTRAWAYLDPISGSIVLQVLAAGFLAGAATFRRSREWLADLISRLRGRGGA